MSQNAYSGSRVGNTQASTQQLLSNRVYVIGFLICTNSGTINEFCIFSKKGICMHILVRTHTRKLCSQVDQN